MTWRPISDDTIIHPDRGSRKRIQPVPDGYTVDSKDPLKAYLSVPDCKFRETEVIKTNTCCDLKKWKCNHYDKFVQRIECHACKAYSS